MEKLKNTFAGFWKYRYLLQNLISRDFKLKYRRSVLGVAWSVLKPPADLSGHVGRVRGAVQCARAGD